MAYDPDYDGVIQAGPYVRADEGLLYEKTTDDIEEVVHLIAGKGTAQHQVKICGAAGTPIGVFDWQTAHQPRVNDAPSSKHAQHGKPCDVIEWLIKGKLVLTTSQTITKGMQLEVINGGMVQEYGTGKIVAIAAEDKTTTGATALIKAWIKINH